MVILPNIIRKINLLLAYILYICSAAFTHHIDYDVFGFPLLSGSTLCSIVLITTLHKFTLMKTDLSLLCTIGVWVNLILPALMVDFVVPHNFEEDIHGLVWGRQYCDALELQLEIDIDLLISELSFQEVHISFRLILYNNIK